MAGDWRRLLTLFAPSSERPCDVIARQSGRRKSSPRVIGLLAVATVRHRPLQQAIEGDFQVFKADPILRSSRPGNAATDFGQIELQGDAVVTIALARHAEHALSLVIAPKRVDQFRWAPRGAQIVAALLVDGKVTDGRAILRRHVRNGGAIRQRE